MFDGRLNYKGTNSYQFYYSQHLKQTPLRGHLLYVCMCVHCLNCLMQNLKSPCGQRMIQKKMSWQSLDIIEDINMTVSNHLSVLLVLIFNLVIQLGHNLYIFAKVKKSQEEPLWNFFNHIYMASCVSVWGVTETLILILTP